MSDLPNTSPPPTEWNWHEMRKSATDRKIAGVCGGFGSFTPVPSWLWRVLFVTSLFFGGIGLIAYIVLWICMPEPKAESEARGGAG